MGGTADQIEREISETRSRMDANLDVLEDRAASSAVRYGRIAAVALAVAGAGVAGLLIHRRLRRPSLQDRLDAVSPETLRELAVEFGSRVKKQFPSVTVSVSAQKRPDPGPLQRILRSVAPAITGSVSTAVIENMARRAEDRKGRRVAAYE